MLGWEQDSDSQRANSGDIAFARIEVFWNAIEPSKILTQAPELEYSNAKIRPFKATPGRESV
jgi:hypothetical protein